eukprot:3329583-Prymnesium_polylepis.1
MEDRAPTGFCTLSLAGAPRAASHDGCCGQCSKQSRGSAALRAGGAPRAVRPQGSCEQRARP